MATGSYEGSLPMEGTPDHHEPSTFTSRRSRWSWRLPHTRKARAPPKETGEPRRRRRPSSHGWKRERRQGCQRYGRTRAPWEENAHAHAIIQAKHKPGRREAREAALRRDNGSCRSTKSGSSVVKTLGPPVKPHRAQTRWGAHAGKLAVVNAGSRRGGGYTQFTYG